MAINKVVYGNSVLVDLTADTVTPSTLLEGYTAHKANGEIITGAVVTASPSDASPAMDGTASAGVATTYSRGDHVHPSDTNKANINNPSFTGIPTAPTASKGTNTTQIATTAFVQSAITDINYPVTSVNSKTGTVVLTASDVNALPDDTEIPTKTSDLTNDSGYITNSDIPVTSVNTKTGDVVLTASDVNAQPQINISGILKGNGTGTITAATAGTDYQAPLPSQTGNTGKFLTTNGSALSWQTVDALPSQSGNTGKFLTTNGSSASWAEVDVPTKTSDLTNDSNFVSDASYVHTDNNFTTTLKNKLDGIAEGATVDDHKWNDVELDKTVISMSNNTARIPFMWDTNGETTARIMRASKLPAANNLAVYDSNSYLTSTTPSSGDNSTKVATTAYVDSAINELGSLLTFKGVVATTGDLPGSGNDVGDVWVVSEDNSEHVWTGEAWERLGPTIDLSGYVPTSRTINNKALSTDITLSASDVGALPSSTEIPTWSYYGTCSTSASTAEKAVTCSGFELKTGAIIGVYFSTAHTANSLSFNVNSTGAKNVIVGGDSTNGKTNVLRWSANTMVFVLYTGNSYAYITSCTKAANAPSRGANTWVGTSSTAATTQAKTATIDNYVLTKGSLVSITFSTANTYTTAEITLNVNSTGAKDVYYNGAVTSSTNTLLWDANETLTFIYDGTGYYFVTKTKPILSSSAITGALGYTPYNSTNPNNYITASEAPVTSVNTKTGAVTLSASDVGAQATVTASGILKGNGSGTITAATAGTDYQTPLPSQTSQSGKFLTTNGTDLSWATVNALPSQTGNSGKFLKTNGTAASWESLPKEVFVATYGTTTLAEILEAYNAGKFIYAVKSNNPGRLVPLEEYVSSIPQFYFSYITRGGTPQDWAVSNSGWTSTANTFGYVPTTRTINSKSLSNSITLTASDVGALPDSTTIPTATSDLTNDSGFITSSDIPVTSVNNKTGAVTLTASDVGALPDTTVIPTATSDLTNDSGFITAVSPALTGTPTAPTATTGTNTTQIATTEFVQNAIGAAITASY